MSRGAWRIGEIEHMATVGRRVRKPVRAGVVSHLLRVAPIGSDAPDLHVSTTIRIEPDPVPVWRVVRSVVVVRASYHYGLAAFTRGANCEAELANSDGSVDDLDTVRGSAMPPGRRCLRNPLGTSAFNGKSMDARLAAFGVVRDRQEGRVGRDAMIVVDPRKLAGINCVQPWHVGQHAKQPSAANHDERSCIRHPVRRLIPARNVLHRFDTISAKVMDFKMVAHCLVPSFVRQRRVIAEWLETDTGFRKTGPNGCRSGSHPRQDHPVGPCIACDRDANPPGCRRPRRSRRHPFLSVETRVGQQQHFLGLSQRERGRAGFWIAS